MQAARGASLSPSGDSGASTPVDAQQTARLGTDGSRRRAISTFVVVAMGLYALDQLTKIWAVAALDDQSSRPLVGDLLQLDLVRNPGAAFSTGTGHTEVFTAIALAAVLVVLWLARRLGSTLWAIALGVLLAGVAGNLTDRLLRSPGPLRGHVVDFLVLPNWPVFNIADVCINLAAALILVQAFRGVRLDGRPAVVPTDSHPDPDPDAHTGSRADTEAQSDISTAVDDAAP